MYDDIEGYATSAFFECVGMINDAIKSDAGIAEIGAYKGKSFCMLNHYSNGKESYAFDIFEDQQFNWPRSGTIDLTMDMFTENLRKHDRWSGKNVHIMKCDTLYSTKLITEDFVKKKVKMFSVDGSHTKHHALNDLYIAEKCITKDGVVILDDFFSSQYAGPTEALFAYEGNLVPFFNVDGALFLCDQSYHNQYYQHVYTRTINAHGGHTEFFNNISNINIVNFSKLLNFDVLWYKYMP